SDVQLIVVRASDTPTYVERGGADLGVAGRDVLAEHGGGGLYQPGELGSAACRMMVAVRKGFDYAGAVRQGARLRVATKYVNITREHFAAKGVHVDLIRLYGSMELAPLVGLADAIVDLVSTGNTLRANRLVAVEQIMPVSARLIVNQAALKTKRAAPQALREARERILEFHQRQLQSSWDYTDAEGTRLGQRVSALDRVGIYVPGGKAAYPSSVLMNALPAKVAGVRELVMVSPAP